MSYELTEQNKEETTIPAGTTRLIVKVHIVPTLTFTTPETLTDVKFKPFIFLDREQKYLLLHKFPADLVKEFFTISTEVIGAFAFARCTSLRSITLPDSLETIGDKAFLRCTALRSITLPDSLETIGMRAFQNCASLTSITLPDSLETIGDQAFQVLHLAHVHHAVKRVSAHDDWVPGLLRLLRAHVH